MDHDHNDAAMSAHRDLRRREVGRWETPPPIDQQTTMMEERLQAIHCRLLERATGGRLTFHGDEIVRHLPRTGCPTPQARQELESLAQRIAIREKTRDSQARTARLEAERLEAEAEARLMSIHRPRGLPADAVEQFE